ncbi:endonuclease III domain-containing protein [Borrelia miyamotoi]|uniref:Endonuclease III n=1 Tax=Borrelia miyamotoi TaxID=47466 RepID=A0AAQ3AGS5_9SPIR|nr:endonuclease III [Borrelia miyamotoi]AGT27689.1 endonuclease III [Borrelia miyamotoi LB-2001]AJA58844.1 endonuclease III [Borrelia miyamotoi]AOW95932.1 endonuclease III [Borrelia miyamotoi]QTL83824.1 endonuclease III [Borrelia miyamotoi]WAZ84870.1 endonuclease III [Borrelia miyamotoi]
MFYNCFMLNIDLIVDEALSRYPDVKPFLTFRNDYELLIMVILSARTTDNMVNKIAPELFKRYGDFESLANADLIDVERLIYKLGFYSNKSKNIINCARMILESFKGVIPDNIFDLVSLPGVGRKTANVILGIVYDKPAIIVDTHFSRVVIRHGLTIERIPLKIELDLKRKIASDKQYRFSMAINKHGRDICTSRSKTCNGCFLEKFAPRVV